MEITVQQYNDDLETSWDNFVNTNQRNATFLHSRKFFNHNPANRADDCSLLFYKNGKLKAVLPACLISSEGKLVLNSHARCTYGGYVLDESIGVEEAVEIVKCTVDFAKQKNAAEIVIRNPFRIFHSIPSDETDYAMWYHGFSIKYREAECAIKLSEHHEQQYEDGTKRSIKKALKNVLVKETDAYDQFWNILRTNLLEKYGKQPTHSYEQFLHLRSLVAADNIKLVGGFIDDKLVAGIVLFICKPTAIHAQYIATDMNYQNARPLNAIIDFIIKWGYKEGFSYFNLGTANEQGGKIINSGLFRFKEGFGARSILRETMHLQIENSNHI